MGGGLLRLLVVAPYPGDLQTITTYTWILLAQTAHPEAAEAFLRFLISPLVQARFKRAGLSLFTEPEIGFRAFVASSKGIARESCGE